ncbi:MAG: sigma-70 family RNA polymerase sigma factor [Thermoanaerobaculia bacterium]
MSDLAPREVTQLLNAWCDGSQEALDRLVPLVYEELHRLARQCMRGERPGHTLQTTELVNEAYMRLVDWKNVRWQNRAHFFGVAAQTMRRVLVDFARSRRSVKRGGGKFNVSLGEAAAVSLERGEDFIALDDALETLSALDPRKARIVELRFFGGMSVDEAAEVLEISSRTVMREWSFAQAWLHRELTRGQSK